MTQIELPILTSQRPHTVSHHSSVDDKIALFRSLFRGREDVYPRRFESRKTGRSGYAPACGNEWVQGICEKPRIKCAECPHRRFLSATDQVIRWHLSGKDDRGRDFVMGIYPMLLDETCFFLAADFDKSHWKDDAAAFLDTCRRMNVPAALERSRSGNGGHVWLFFEQSIPAVLARKLASHILTETMDRRPDIGLESYDRFFPNQDTLPHGGFGNLIALPLQRQARESGNSVFLDDQFVPYSDQWAFLSIVRKIPHATVESIVRAAEEKGRLVGVRMVLDDENNDAPWTAAPSRRHREPALVEPLPKKLELILGNEIYIATEHLPAGLRNRLIRLAAFQNPEFYKAQAMRLSTYGKPRIIGCAEQRAQHIGLPRGCIDEVLKLFADLGIKALVRDERFAGNRLELTFHGELRPDQKIAADALVAHDTGVLSATTAFGKTVVAAWLIAQRGVNALILVHRRQLLEQWRARLSTFLDLPEKQIGQIGAGRKKPTGVVDVAIIQSLVRKGEVDDQAGKYGHLIIDECHHLSAQSFEQVARRFKGRFVTGLSATMTRKDGHHPIIFMQCGPIRHRVNAKEQAAARPFEHMVFVRPTGFEQTGTASPDARIQFHDLYDELIADETRNRLICTEVIKAVRDGRSPVVLTERNEHLDLLAKAIEGKVAHLIVLRGGMGRKELKSTAATLSTLPESEERVLLATGRFLGEGFDDARLDTLFLTLPVSWRGTIAQYVGRLHRLHDMKRQVQVYDYADINVPMLSRMFDRRCKGYESLGYTILLPASAVAGWPPDVPLPVDPQWKNEYAASVRRLVRDGVDASLANLFVHVTRVVGDDSEGANRARSASEAFLFRRLETLPETRGHFRLNTRLPIGFDGNGSMEVDLICSTARLVIEIDGDQHLSDATAYRRDRRKDQLLQENGYFVLRFLAQDIGKNLDSVLDAILRTLSCVRNRQFLPRT